MRPAGIEPANWSNLFLQRVLPTDSSLSGTRVATDSSRYAKRSQSLSTLIDGSQRLKDTDLSLYHVSPAPFTFRPNDGRFIRVFLDFPCCEIRPAATGTFHFFCIHICRLNFEGNQFLFQEENHANADSPACCCPSIAASTSILTASRISIIGLRTSVSCIRAASTVSSSRIGSSWPSRS